MDQILTKSDQELIEAATNVCAEEEIDFNSLDARQTRGLIYYWCSSCNRIYPLTHLVVARRKNICVHCKEKVKMYSNSNKYGKLRRKIFNRMMDMREKKSSSAAAAEIKDASTPPYEMNSYEKVLAGDMEKLELIIKARGGDSQFKDLDLIIRQNMHIIRKITGLRRNAARP